MITTRCNMTCEHCCFSCTEEGEDMSVDTFKKVLTYCEGGHITLGGGEPTLHPDFKLMLLEAIAASESVWLATNGTQTKTSLLLAKLARAKVIGCALSIDHYHDYMMVDSRVRDAFGYAKPAMFDKGNCEVRDVSMDIKNVGRARETGAGCEDGCACGGPVFKPDGNVYWCGCPNAISIGNVHDGFKLSENYYDNDCYNDYLKSYDPEEEAKRDADICEQYLGNKS